MTQQTQLTGRVLMSGTIECRDATGVVVKTMQFSGSLPLGQLTPEQRAQLTQESHGTDHRQ
jgi:hypothetical protein